MCVCPCYLSYMNGFLVFCFKQKTAYEMRISDWISDVCSSDPGFGAPGIDQIIAERLGLEGVERTLVGFMGCYAAVAALRTARHIVRSEPDAREIGRASCRERVCKYV